MRDGGSLVFTEEQRRREVHGRGDQSLAFGVQQDQSDDQNKESGE
jgi:hypothetical protein